MLDNGRPVHLEEEIFIRLSVTPSRLCLFFEFGTGARGNENRAVRTSRLECIS
jgi:hypothetical protein